MRVVVTVPRRADNGPRDRVWRWLAERWAVEHPGWPVVEGHHDDGPFNRSAAINRAATLAGRWDVAVIADADSFVGADQLTRAVDTAWRSGQMTFAFGRWAHLTAEMSDAVMAGFGGCWDLGVDAELWDSCSSMVVVPRALWDATGGFDEGFRGWGFEDVAFSVAATALGGGFERVEGTLWHLWHPTAVCPPELAAANQARLQRYIDARDAGDIDRLAALARLEDQPA